jgi:hypothetical protein
LLVEEWDGDLEVGFFGEHRGKLFGFCCVTMICGSGIGVYGYGVA